MLHITPIPAFNDNYIWLIINPHNQCCAIVDPGTVTPVLPALTKHNLTPTAILLTHHHKDHTGGVTELLTHYSVPVYSGSKDSFNTKLLLPELELTLTVIPIPGHTLDHVAYFGAGNLFCGDTLFTGGCGKVFEGTPLQMYESLNKLKNLPEETQVYCGHEYTLNNLAFAIEVEPNNPILHYRMQASQQLRKQNLPTVPASLALEKQTNPFLRTHLPEIIKTAQTISGKDITDPAEVFTIIRKWKDQWSPLSKFKST